MQLYWDLFHWKVKKKRFIRWVMRYRVQRNEAEKLAARVREFGSYLNLERAVIREVCRASKAFGDLLKAYEGGWSLAKAMEDVRGDVWKKFGESYWERDQ